jgi:hypothetical protein
MRQKIVCSYALPVHGGVLLACVIFTGVVLVNRSPYSEKSVIAETHVLDFLWSGIVSLACVGVQDGLSFERTKETWC